MGKKAETPTPADPNEPLAEGAVLSDGLMPIVEAAQIIVPKKGKLFEDRVIEGQPVKVAKFAIIRPCQSKGRSIRGHQPIYEARMLAENASVFTNWPMYLDHASEELIEGLSEWLQERGRSLKDLGGRVIKSFYDPEVSFESDEENGYRKGAVVGEVIPQPLVRGMLEADPLSLAVSINAWPKSVRIGKSSWSPTVKGAIIEGIRATPMGSVDFVPRGGAGGRVLTEEEVASAVSLLESAYSASRDEDPDPKERGTVKKKLSEMTAEEVASLSREELAEALRQENPSLAESLTETPPVREETAPLTQADLDRALTEQRTALVEEFGGTKEAAEALAEEMVEEREELRDLRDLANKKLSELERNGLPKEYVEEIRKNYILLPSGPRDGLLVEARTEDDGTTLTKEQVLEARIKADAETAVRLIEAAGGTVRVKGLGASGRTDTDTGGNGGGTGEKKKVLREGSAFGDFMRESGDFTGDPEKDRKKLSEMVEG